MSHHHHHHHHDHGSDHQDATPAGTLSFEEKMSRLLEHWVGHNDDHAQNYRDWAAQAKDNQLTEVAGLLEEAARMTDEISEKFKAAARLMDAE